MFPTRPCWCHCAVRRGRTARCGAARPEQKAQPQSGACTDAKAQRGRGAPGRRAAGGTATLTARAAPNAARARTASSVAREAQCETHEPPNAVRGRCFMGTGPAGEGAKRIAVRRACRWGGGVIKPTRNYLVDPGVCGRAGLMYGRTAPARHCARSAPLRQPFHNGSWTIGVFVTLHLLPPGLAGLCAHWWPKACLTIAGGGKWRTSAQLERAPAWTARPPRGCGRRGCALPYLGVRKGTRGGFGAILMESQTPGL